MIFFLYACLIVSIQVCRNRSFWLDEAALLINVIDRTRQDILLNAMDTQQFPKIYLMLIDTVMRIFDFTPFWARLIPMLFGLGAFAIWLLLFYEHYWLRKQQKLACVASSGLLVVCSSALSYAYEFKQYSAELFFSGLLLFLYQTPRLPQDKRLSFLVVAGISSFFFSYTALLVWAIVFGLTLIHPDQWPPWFKNRRFLLTGMLGSVLVAALLYRIDYQHGLYGGNGVRLHDYWSAQFVSGNTLAEKFVSLNALYRQFLFGWWRTEWGSMCERLASPGAWYVWPWRTLKNPDIRNVLYTLSLVVLVLCLWRLKRFVQERDILAPSVLILVGMGFLAWKRVYPWGETRLSLYAMPLAILLITEGIELGSAFLVKLPKGRLWRIALWVPFLWIILRNGIFMLGGFSVARLGEDINPAIRKMSSTESRYLVVPGSTDLVLRTYPNPPKGIQIIYEKNVALSSIFQVIKNEPLYFIWVHNPPPRNQNGVPAGYEVRYKTAQRVYIGDQEYGPDLLLLKP